MKKSVFPLQNETALLKKEKKLLARQFFPSYLSNMKYLINAIHKIHPKTSFLLTAKLLSIAGRKKLSTNAIAFYSKGIKRKIEVDGATFYIYTYGKGPAILMLHGWCSNAARWRVYVNELVRSGYSVVVVDAPGHGTAPGRFLSIFLYAKGIKRILELESEWYGVITHSISGLIAMAALGKSAKKYHPSKFIMMNTFATATTVLEKFSSCLGISEKVLKGTKNVMSNNQDFPLEEFSIRRHYNTINAEGLLIYDSKDYVVPTNEAAYIIDNIQPLQTIRAEGLGHNLRSKDIVKKVLNFINNKTTNTLQAKKIVKKVVTYV